MPALPGAPTSELGVVNPDATNLPLGIQGLGGRVWSSAAQVAEEDLPELRWPDSIRVYQRMSRTAQVSGLQRAVWLAATRRHWALKPRSNVSEQAMLKMSDDLDLPIQGAEDRVERLRTRDRFSWAEFLRLLLMAPTRYGHYYFEQVGSVDTDGWWRLSKLAPRPPRTIQQFFVDAQGGLISVEQNNYPPSIIPVNRLVGFIWDQEDASWVGESMLRELYIPWLKLDRLNRIDVVHHERNGAGIPMFELPEGAGPADQMEGQKMTEQVRVGAYSGGTHKFGSRLRLQGVEGGTSDVLASIQHEEELMARAWMAMLIQLGQTQTGSRALGGTFADWWNDGIDAICNWARSIIQAHVIEDWVDLNLGEAAEAPEVVFTTPAPELAVTDLVALVESNVIRVDDTLESAIRDTRGLPPQTGPVRVPPATAPNPAPLRAVAGEVYLPGHRVSIDGREVSKEIVARLATGALRRELNEIELSAGFDPNLLDAAWQRAVQEAQAAMRAGRDEQIAELAEAVRKAGSQAALAAVQASSAPISDLAEVLAGAAGDGVTSAVQEAERQGTTITEAAASRTGAFAIDRASAVQHLVANSLSQAAVRKALTLSSKGGGAEVAAEVETHLRGLSDSWLRDQAAGAVTAAQNEGRYAAFAQHKPKLIAASEILDTNCCAPCANRDGYEYDTLSAARNDYPTGGFKDCLGGPRCRGTIVVVW